jgi:hypothetical protein
VIHYLAGITVQEQALSCLRGLLTELDRNHPIRLRVASACHDWLADDQGAILSQQVDLCAHALPEVERLARELLEKMQATGHPFVLGSECDVLSVPGSEREIMAKVEAFMKA